MRICHCTLPLFNPRACESCANPIYHGPDYIGDPPPGQLPYIGDPIPVRPTTTDPHVVIPNPPIRTGWVCPTCGTIYSPDVTTCLICNLKRVLSPEKPAKTKIRKRADRKKKTQERKTD